jgi:hypothetical protein
VADSSQAKIIHCFEDAQAFAAAADGDLGHGRLFVPGAYELAEREPCHLRLEVRGAAAGLELSAESVWVRSEEPGAGVGLALNPFDADVRQRIEDFAAVVARAAPQGASAGADSGSALFVRVRAYRSAEQLRHAREGDISERQALERVWGKAVWEALLQNPRISPPEVARIARKGNIPRPLIDSIASVPAWLASQETRRALLSNPRLGPQALERVLCAMSRQDLQLVSSQSAYSAPVRQAAKKRLGGAR